LAHSAGRLQPRRSPAAFDYRALAVQRRGRRDAPGPICKILGKRAESANPANRCLDFLMISAAVLRGLQIFTKLFLGESGNSNGLRSKKFGFAFFAPASPGAPPQLGLMIGVARQIVNVLFRIRSGRGRGAPC
jgi:hypothetical protein